MKKVANIVLLAVLAAGLLSCTKTDRFYGNPQKEIAMNPVMHSMTKAEVPGPVTGSQYPDAEHFGVLAYYSPLFTDGQEWTSLTSVQPYFEDREFAKKGDTFSGSPKCYWPHQGSLVLAGYSPYGSGTPSFNCSTKTLTITGFESNGQTDLMYFLPNLSNENHLVGRNSSTSPVPAAFSHALTLLEFNVYGLEGDETIKIKKVTVNNWRSQGDFSVTVGGAPAWTEGEIATTQEIYKNNNGAEISHETPVEIQTLVIPGTTTDITITYDIHAAETHTDKTATITAAEIDEFVTWATGKKYIYNITISSKFINIVPLVGDFGFGSNYSENIK